MRTKKGLKPFTSETGAEAGRKGGIASGESLRRANPADTGGVQGNGVRVTLYMQHITHKEIRS